MKRQVEGGSAIKQNLVPVSEPQISQPQQTGSPVISLVPGVITSSDFKGHRGNQALSYTSGEESVAITPNV